MELLIERQQIYFHLESFQIRSPPMSTMTFFRQVGIFFIAAEDVIGLVVSCWGPSPYCLSLWMCWTSCWTPSCFLISSIANGIYICLVSIASVMLYWCSWTSAFVMNSDPRFWAMSQAESNTSKLRWKWWEQWMLKTQSQNSHYPLTKP